MIPQAAITHWRHVAPWPQDVQVEQDLILCGGLIEIFQAPEISRHLILRGGTALHKLCVTPPLRYSEDIDLVQRTAGPIGPLLDVLRTRLDPFLGIPKRERHPGNVTLRYCMVSEIPPIAPLRLKIEINTREHFNVFGIVSHLLHVRSPWFDGEASIPTYTLEELLATKLRALYQRRKGRDLFDLWIGLNINTVTPAHIIEAFRHYLKAENLKITRAEFEKNLTAKVSSSVFCDDLMPLLATTVAYDAERAADVIRERLLTLL